MFTPIDITVFQIAGRGGVGGGGGKSSQWGGSEVLLGGGDVLPGEGNLRWSDLTIRAFLKAKHHSENIEHILKSKLP